MLSICIPVYNFDVNELVHELHAQCLIAGIAFEIILIDDASQDIYRTKNLKLKQLTNVQFIQLHKNIGRAKIRNLFTQYCRFTYLLFMDCDSKVRDSKFISTYLANCKENQIICGGTIYEIQTPDKEMHLRWLVGIEREQIEAEIRKQNPHKSFMTNNFLITKSLLQEVKFDERITGYGHEDTLFGLELKKRNIPILHIDNPLYHIGLESNQEFINKTIQAVRNLFILQRLYSGEVAIADDVKLLGKFEQIKKTGLHYLLIAFYTMFRRLIKQRAARCRKSLFWFDLFKLCLYAYYSRKGNARQR